MNKELKFIKLFESFSHIEEDELEGLKKKYPMAEITMTPNKKFKESYFARVDLIKQNGEKEYLGALRGPVSKDDALLFFKNVLAKNYDKFY